MHKALLIVNGGGIANVFIDGEWRSGQGWELRGEKEDLFQRAIEIANAWKIQAIAGSIPEVDEFASLILNHFVADLKRGEDMLSQETDFDPCGGNVSLSWKIEEVDSSFPIIEVIKPSTPSAQWFRRGEDDPHGQGFTNVERSKLMLGRLSDDELGNAVFLCDHRSLDLQAVLRGEPSSIALLTAAKERIRWLSRKTQWPTSKITVFGDTEILKEVADAAGSRQFLISLAEQMEWNCLKGGVFADEEYTAFDVNGIVVDEKGETESVSVHDPRVTQWAVYGRVSDTTAFAMHDCNTLDDALSRAVLLAKIYQ